LTKLADIALPEVAGRMATPGYDRSMVRTGIVHFGVGGFHRSHQAMYLDRLMNDGHDMDWGICGVGLLPGDAGMRDALQAQDGLYTLLLKDSQGTREPRVIGSIVDYLFAPDDPESVLATLTRSTTRIVSLTITEGGYNFNQATGEFLADEPDVSHDLDRLDAPKTVFGFVVESLRRRRELGIAPFVVVSCDNIPENGDVAKRSFVAFAELVDPELARWICAEVAFPSSMVDRITPNTTDADRAEVARAYGVEDAWPVVAEPFTQWVLEDLFAVRPQFEAAGVHLVDDVRPYELMKLRLLNVGHQALAYSGYLLGHRYAHEAATDPLTMHLLTAYLELEATPTLQPVPGIDLADYRRSLVQRFSNAEIHDPLTRLCAESSDRIPKWLVPVIREQLALRGSTRYSAAIIATWARYADGIDEAGHAIDVVDARRDERVAAARCYRTDPLAFIRNESLFGDLALQDQFARDYLWCLDSLYTVGVRRTLEALAGNRVSAGILG
jgi:mannitol 2-dehydrogenase